MRIIWPFSRKPDPEDFSAYLSAEQSTTKQALISECQRRGVTIFVNDSSESSAGVYAKLRAVASEAELQDRLFQAVALHTAKRANFIAWLALVVGLAGLVVAVLK